MMNTVIAFIVGALLGMFIALSYPHALHSALAKVGLGNIGQSTSETTH